MAKQHKFKKSRTSTKLDANGAAGDVSVVPNIDLALTMTSSDLLEVLDSDVAQDDSLAISEFLAEVPQVESVAQSSIANDEFDAQNASEMPPQKSKKSRSQKKSKPTLADAVPHAMDIADGSGAYTVSDQVDQDKDADVTVELAESTGHAVVTDSDNVAFDDILQVSADDTADDLPTAAAAMDGNQLAQLIEALVFATDKPLTIQRIRQLTRVADVLRIETALEKIAVDYADRGIVLTSVSGGYQFRTRTAFSAWVQQLIAGRPVRLSRAQLETLAIIAYRQPITRPEVDEIRGVDSGGTLKVLLDRQLIRSLGKREEVGRPVLYGTTKEFLDFFSLGDLRELPTLREYSELTDESRSMMKKMGLEAPEMALASQHLDDDQLTQMLDNAEDGPPTGPQEDEAATTFAADVHQAMDDDTAVSKTLTEGSDGEPASDLVPLGTTVPEQEMVAAGESPVPSWIVDITTDDIESITDVSATHEVTPDGEWPSPGSDIDVASDDTDEEIP